MQVPRRGVLAAIGAATAGAGTAATVASARSADSLPRPRVLATGADFDRVARLRGDEEFVSGWYETVASRADELLAADPVEYRLSELGNILRVSRRVLSRVRILGLVYRITGDDDYAARAWREVAAAAGFDDWHPDHFLDTAEMTNALGTAYDWFHDYWDDSQRATIRTALFEKGLDPGIAAHDGSAAFPTWWTQNENNWNAVCNGGLSVGALALLGDDPVDEARLETLLSATTRSIRAPFENFGRDGGWPEGYTYWNYNTRYLAYYATTLLNTLGGAGSAGVDVTTEIPDVDGFPAAGDFPVGITGPAGSFNFSDAGSGRRSMPVLFWLARRFGEPGWAAFQRNTVGTGDGGVTDLLWYDPEGVGDVTEEPRDMRFRGIEVATLRDRRRHFRAAFVGFKGGDNRTAHGDLDLGSFVYDAGGNRWATDLGAEDYGVPGYWSSGRGGSRWRYYRKRAEGHNTLVVDPGWGPSQDPTATAEIAAFETGEGGGYGIVDLSTAYGPAVDRLHRGFAFDRETGALLVQDELSNTVSATVWWFMHTRAQMLIDGARATLTGLDNLRARILAPGDATFREMDAGPLSTSPDPDVQSENDDVSKLAIELEDVADLTIAVQLLPLADGDPPDPPTVRPLDDWTVAYASHDARGTATRTATDPSPNEGGSGTASPTGATSTADGAAADSETGSPGASGFGAAGALGSAALAAWWRLREEDTE